MIIEKGKYFFGTSGVRANYITGLFEALQKIDVTKITKEYSKKTKEANKKTSNIDEFMNWLVDEKKVCKFVESYEIEYDKNTERFLLIKYER